MPEIVADDISRAWLGALSLADAQPRHEISNLVVHIQDIGRATNIEIDGVRPRLDQELESAGCFSVSTVASTIFPSSLWKQGEPRERLFNRYRRLWPRIQAHKRNRRGTYFQRLIDLPGPSGPPFNQLEFVISAYNSGVRRRSALQCGLLVPHLDSNATPYQGFPCMQQLAFIPEGKEGLRISAFYPMHYLCARAYGNYLGLINLGRFVASQIGRELSAMTCIALVAKVDQRSLANAVLEATSEV